MSVTMGQRRPRFTRWVQALKRRRLLFAAPVLACVGVAVVCTALQAPTYQGTARLLLSVSNRAAPFNPQNGQRQDQSRIIDAQAQLITGRAVQGKVRTLLGQAPHASAAAEGLSDVVAVQATAPDARQAADIANAYAYAYLDLLRTTTVDNLLTAANQIEGQLTTLQAQLQALGPEPASSSDDTSVTLRQTLAAQRDSLTKQLDNLQLGASIGSGGASLLAAATPPASPVTPKPVTAVILALLAGAVLGAVAVALADYFDDSIQDADDLARAGSELPLIATVPMVPSRSRDGGPNVISLSEPASAAAEAYRSLRTAIRFLVMGAASDVLQVTSPSAGDGKSTTAANLAAVMAAAGQRVCLVDCDLRRPQVADFFGLPNTVGFTSVVIGESTIADALRRVPDEPRLYILPAGPVPPYPAELLTSAEAGATLEELRAKFDVVVVDSPPLLAVTDAAVITQDADVVLLVVAEGRTTLHALDRAVEMLDQVRAPVAGLILNRSRAQAETPSEGPGWPVHVKRPSPSASVSTAASERETVGTP